MAITGTFRRRRSTLPPDAQQARARQDGRLVLIPMRPIVVLAAAAALAGAPAQAGLMDILDAMQPVQQPQRLVPTLPPMPSVQTRGKNWVGTRRPKDSMPILVMAGHADSQRMHGSGTPGRAVDRGGAAPMQAGITDELYWNLLTAQAVVKEGQKQGLNIRFYDPGVRTIRNENDARTNWSVGSDHASLGGYALEIHYDAYSPHGIGPGVIPAVAYGFSVLDEALADEFGAYPYHYRGMLGAPRRGISMLEIGQLEGALEADLRNPAKRQLTLTAIAKRVVAALQQGLERPDADSTAMGPIP